MFELALRACAAAGDVRRAFQLVAVMWKRSGVEVSHSAHFSVLRALCNAGELQRAVRYLSDIPSRRMQNLHCNVVLHGAVSRGGWKDRDSSSVGHLLPCSVGCIACAPRPAVKAKACRLGQHLGGAPFACTCYVYCSAIEAIRRLLLNRQNVREWARWPRAVCETMLGQ